MWRPSRPQWIVIWMGFAATLWFFFWESQQTSLLTRAEHLVLGVAVATGTALLALLLYLLELRKDGKF